MSILSCSSLESLGVKFSKNGRIICNKKNWSILSALPFTSVSVTQFNPMDDCERPVSRTLPEALKIATKILNDRDPSIVASEGGTANGRPCLSVYDCCGGVNLYL